MRRKLIIESIWLLALVLASYLICGLLSGFNGFWPKDLELSLHDTYIIINWLVIFMTLFLLLSVPVIFLRIIFGFGRLFSLILQCTSLTIIIAFTVHILITLQPLNHLVWLTPVQNLFNFNNPEFSPSGGWTVYPPLSATNRIMVEPESHYSLISLGFIHIYVLIIYTGMAIHSLWFWNKRNLKNAYN
ncbi:MAG: hypothetical protein GC181_11565 [Bacteroidetes bacterium]|nr:hypothetical protein [Bacteroidota bacterium]